jgi:purine nucleoside phosphorylase
MKYWMLLIDSDNGILNDVIANKEVAYIPRHSEGHSVPPHKINFRANIEALNIMCSYFAIQASHH